MPEALELTTPEAAFVLGKDAREVKRAIDRGVVEVHRVLEGGTAHRYLGFADLVYLRACERLSGKLTPAARDDLYRHLRDHLHVTEMMETPAGDRDRQDYWARIADMLRHHDFSENVQDKIDLGWASINVKSDVAFIAGNLSLLAEVKSAVQRNDLGEPVIPGTDIEVYRIVALLEEGASSQDVLHEHPGLTFERLEWARAYAAARPKRGRPFPKKGLKRGIRDLGLGALDEVLGPPGAQERPKGGNEE